MLLAQGELDGVRILERSTVRSMAHNQIAGMQVPGWKTTRPQLSNDVELYPGIPKGWGLSFLITADATPEGRSPGSLSWAGIANTYYWIDHAAGVAGVFITQVLPFYDAPSLHAFRSMERETYAGC
jgi:CubicO group peptidase (beta-lactamase class C family)